MRVKLACILFACSMCFGCGVTEIPKGPYQAEVKLTSPHSDDAYHFEKLNEFTFAIANLKTGQVWECNIHDGRCSQVMYPALNPETNLFGNWSSTPDITNAVIEQKR
jgi:hypothetical protein